MEFLTTEADRPASQLLLAHGAGAPMTSPFMDAIAAAIAARGVKVLRFEFAYMAQRRDGGPRRPPPRAELLRGELREATMAARALAPRLPLFIGGKSMGGRVATMIADALFAEHVIAGVACLGYPAHPPGKPEQTRTQHLEQLACPTLFIQGERDPFGSRDEFSGYALSPVIEVVWAPDGDHDLGPRGRSEATRKSNLNLAADRIAAFCTAASP